MIEQTVKRGIPAKVGDIPEPLGILVVMDDTRQPMAITAGTTARFIVTKYGDEVINSSASVDTESSMVEFTWTSQTILGVGVYSAFFELTFPGGAEKLVIPQKGSIQFEIESLT